METDPAMSCQRTITPSRAKNIRAYKDRETITALCVLEDRGAGSGWASDQDTSRSML